MWQDNFSKYLSLREKHPRFTYESYHYSIGPDSLVFGFEFRLSDDIVFHPVSEIPWKEGLFMLQPDLSEEQHSMISRLVFSIGMTELVSYWKAACSPVVSVPVAGLSKEQVDFWKKLYFNGLGEFFYTNGIPADEQSFMTIEAEDAPEVIINDLELQGAPLVPVGGGKDSAVTAGLLNRSGKAWIPFAINPTAATRAVIGAAGKSPEETLFIVRNLDPKLLELNGRGYLNGHTPFSAIVAFYGLLAAFLTGSSDIILSNESSANEATIPGTRINHQYSKSLEFEGDFRGYVRKWISPSFNYFSLLRPLTELQIAAHFAGFAEFHRDFRSCNAGSKTGVWCGKCPKCLFTWVILSPFMTQEALRDIFGKDLLEDAELKGTLDELCGSAENKPFECVGTIYEVNLALDKLIRMYEGRPLPELLEHYRTVVSGAGPGTEAFEQAMAHREHGHFVPGEYYTLLMKTNDAR